MGIQASVITEGRLGNAAGALQAAGKTQSRVVGPAASVDNIVGAVGLPVGDLNGAAPGAAPAQRLRLAGAPAAPGVRGECWESESESGTELRGPSERSVFPAPVFPQFQRLLWCCGYAGPPTPRR